MFWIFCKNILWSLKKFFWKILFLTKIYFLGDLKVLQYFGNVRHISTIPDPFVEVMKGTKHIGIQDTKFTWYSPSDTHWICHYGLEHGLRLWFSAYLTFINHWGSSNRNQLFWIIWSFDCDQLSLIFLPNKCFWLIL